MKLKTMMVALMSLPLFAVAKPPVDVKVLAWNVYMLPKPIKFSIQQERIGLITDRLAALDHDVIILSEAFQKKFRTKVAEALFPTHPHQVSLGKSGYWKQVMPSGVMALSRYPMRMLTHDFYNYCTKADCYSSKGVMILEVELPFGKKIHIAATHLNSGQSQVSRDVRKTQVEQIASLNDSLNNEEVPSIPLILAGDLNIDGNGDEFAPTLETLGMSSTELKNPEVESSDYHVPCYKTVENPSKKWVDHILLDQRSTKTEVLNKRIRTFYGMLKGTECALSDHQAVEATVRIYE